jgi:DNA mismatch endonuclease (patch repair protein)
MPKSKKRYWAEKIAGNRARDAKKRRHLRALGWKVVVVWECELKKPAKLADKLSKSLDRFGGMRGRKTG